MKDINHYTCTCRVGKDPEVRKLNNSESVASFSVAVSSGYKNKQGEWVETTNWLNIVSFRGLASIVDKYVRKGDKLTITGELRTRTYEDKSGVTKYVTEIIAKDIVMNGNKSVYSSTANNEPSKSEDDTEDETDSLPF